MSKAPAFQFYAAEYLADERVQLMSIEEEGVYIRLLSYCWREGSIPADPVLLSRLCKGANVGAMGIVTSAFSAMRGDPSRLVHERLEGERKKQEAFRKKQKGYGEKGAKKRWDEADRVAHAEPIGLAKASPSHEPPLASKGSDGSSSAASSSSSTSVLAPLPESVAGGAVAPTNAGVHLPTLAQARAFAPSAGVDADVAEIWWNDCEARPLAPTGHYSDRDGNAIRNWHAHLTSYGRKWQSNDARAAQGRRQPPSKPGASAPVHKPEDNEKL